MLVAIIAPLSAIAVVAMLAQGQSLPRPMYGVTAILLVFLVGIVPTAKTVWRNRPHRVDPRKAACSCEIARPSARKAVRSWRRAW